MNFYDLRGDKLIHRSEDLHEFVNHSLVLGDQSVPILSFRRVFCLLHPDISRHIFWQPVAVDVCLVDELLTKPSVKSGHDASYFGSAL